MFRLASPDRYFSGEDVHQTCDSTRLRRR